MKNILSLVIVVFLFFAALPSFAAYQPPSSDIIVFVDEEGGIRKEISNLSRTPIFCLYKDGRLLYSTVGQDGLIFLMETKLDEVKIAEVKKFFASSDEWNDIYDESPAPDMPVVKVTVNLDGNVKTFSVRGIDYALKQRIIPKDLADFYKYAAYFSDPEAKEYESDEIYLYVKPVEKPADDSLNRIIGWRVNVDLASLSLDAGLSGVAVAKLDGKNAKRTLKLLKFCTPYMTADLPVFVRQKRNYYSVAFRPCMPHELSGSRK